MPPISQLKSSSTKMLLIGDSGAGKTGALASLAARGFKVRLVDIDKGSDILRGYLTDPASPYVKENPQAAENIDIIRLSDPMKAIGGQLYAERAIAWRAFVDLLNEWKYKDEASGQTVSLGKPFSWGPDTVLVIDSLSMLATIAMHFHLSLNAALGKSRTQNEGRRDIGATQQLLKDLLETLFSDALKCHVIVISHVTMVTEAGGMPKVEEGEFASVPTGYPSAVGRALSPHIPRWFNSMLIARVIGAGASAKHKIFTRSQNLGSSVIAGKTSSPLRVKPEYDLAWGLAEYIKDAQS